MSGYLHPNSQSGLPDDDAQHLYYHNQGGYSGDRGKINTSAGYSQQSQWSPVAYTDMGSASIGAPSQPYAAPSQYVSWPNNYPQLEPVGYLQGQYAPSSAAVLPSTPYTDQLWPNAPWPSLHPDDVEASSDVSRSTSPNPSDLGNFGMLLADGRSWRCAFPGCTSQATFTRGCDLRKHYKRHTKSLFCRHEDCPQATEGGFSSNKDRVSLPITCTVEVSSPKVRISCWRFVKPHTDRCTITGRVIGFTEI